MLDLGRSKLAVALLGGFGVSVGDAAVSIVPRKVRALLAYLALETGRRHSREALATLLWDDSDDRKARNSLRQALVVLRQALPREAQDAISVDPGGLSLDGGRVRTDVLDFETLIAEGSPGSLEKAVALYRGEFLEGQRIGAQPFEDWLMFERRRLREKALGALERLIGPLREAGELARAVELSVRALAMDPIRESVHRELMQTYAEQGQFGAALRQYRLCRSRLRGELNVSPDAETERVHAQIRGRRLRHTRPVGDEPSQADAGDTVPPAGVRQVTVLVVSAECAVGDADDRESLDLRLTAFFEQAASVLSSHGGVVAAHVGTTLMGIFGIERASGSETRRALQAAPEIHALSAGDGRLSIRVAVTSGRVMVSGRSSTPYQERIIVGDAVERAMALVNAAQAGQTLLSESVKGTLAARAGALHRFVGRQSQLLQFASAVEVSRDAGSGHIFLIRGDAGIGKSRLASEFAELARARGFSCHRTEFWDFGGGADVAIRRLVEGLYEEDQIPPEHQVFANALLGRRQPPALHALYQAMDEPTRVNGKQRLLTELIFSHTAERPLLLIVEDLQWADASELDYLTRSFEAVCDCPAILVMTCRSHDEPAAPAWRAALRTHALTTIQLGPLRREEAVALAESHSNHEREFVRQCIDRSAGNPLFLLLLLGTEGEPGHRVPESVQNLVMARMDRLPPPARVLLQAASVLEPSFRQEQLACLVDAQVMDDGLLVEEGWILPNGVDLVFVHALIREAIYSSMLGEQRRALHLRAARRLAQHDPVLRARHLERAGDPGAAAAYASAVEALVQEHRFEAALRLADQGSVLARERAVRCRLGRLRGDILHELGRVSESLQALAAALDDADGDQERCWLWIGQAAGMRVLDRYEEALGALDQAQEAAHRGAVGPGSDGDPSEALAQIHNYRGNIYFPLGEHDKCLAEHLRAREYAAQCCAIREEARALSGIGDALYLRGQVVSARRQLDSCVRFCRRHGLRDVEMSSLGMRGFARLFQNDLDGALKDALQAGELAIKLGDRRAEILAHDVAADVYLHQGAWKKAVSYCERALAVAVRLGSRRFEAEVSVLLAGAHLGQNRPTEALAWLDRARGVAFQSESTYCGPLLLGTLARVVGDSAQRESALAEGEALLGRRCPSHSYLYFYRDAMEACLSAGDWDQVERYARALEEYTSSEPLPWSDFFIARARALAAAMRSKPGDRVGRSLRQLATTARRAKLLAALPALEAALGA